MREREKGQVTTETSGQSEYDEIVAVICAELDKHNPDGVALGVDTDITAELTIDSVAVMDMLFVLEERFDASVPLNALGETRTVADLARAVQQAMPAAPGREG